MVDSLLTSLDSIIRLGPEAAVTFLYDGHHVPGSLALVAVRHEALTQLLDGLAAEAGQARIQHQGDEGDDGVLVRSVTHAHTSLSLNTLTIDRSIRQTSNLNNKRFNHKHCQVPYYLHFVVKFLL